MGFSCDSDSEESACNVRDLDSIPGLGRSPGGGHGNPLQYSCLENPHGQRNLVGCSPWGHKESDTPEAIQHTHRNVKSAHMDTLNSFIDFQTLKSSKDFPESPLYLRKLVLRPILLAP